MKSDKDEILRKVKAETDKGLSVKDACEKLGVNHFTVYGWRNQSKIGKPRRRKTVPKRMSRRHPASTVTLLPASLAKPQQLVALIGAPDVLLEAIRGLQ